jgi:integrase
MAKRRAKVRGQGEGTIFLDKKTNTYRARIQTGIDLRTGKPVYISCRRKSYQEASAWYRQNIHRSSARLIQKAEKLTVQEWLVKYVEKRTPEVRHGTLANYDHYLKKILPSLGRMQLDKVTPTHIWSFYNSLTKEGLSPSVRQHIHHFLKAAFREALQIEQIERNPFDRIAAPKGGKVVEAKVWSAADARRFLAEAKYERLYGAFYLMLHLGLRVGEVLGLMWADIEGDRLTIKRTLIEKDHRPGFNPPKTERDKRLIYFLSDVGEVLQERDRLQAYERSVASDWQDWGLIFSSMVGTPIDVHNFRRLHRSLIKRSGVPYIRVHDLRHTYITLARDAGVDVEVLAQRVGQDPRVTLKTYSHPTDERMRKAALPPGRLFGEGTMRAPATVQLQPKRADQNTPTISGKHGQHTPSNKVGLQPKSYLRTSHARGRRFKSSAAHHVRGKDGRPQSPVLTICCRGQLASIPPTSTFPASPNEPDRFQVG